MIVKDKERFKPVSSLFGIFIRPAQAQCDLPKAQFEGKRSIQRCINDLLAKLEETDKYTVNHSKEVAEISELFARKLNLPEDKVEKVKQAALLHDVGKIDIPEKILNKPKSLCPEELTVIQEHSQLGAEKISTKYPELKELIPAIMAHHEHWNGAGYPAKLSKTQIPIESRIISIADTYHAMRGRCYRKSASVHESCKTLLEGAGSQWDPILTDKFVKLVLTNQI